MICSGTLSKTRLQQLRGYTKPQTLTTKAFQRNHNSVTAITRNRSARSIQRLRNRARGYSAIRLQTCGYAQTLVTQGFGACVTVVTVVTAKNNDAGGTLIEGGAR